jgi:hypothetical protein
MNTKPLGNFTLQTSGSTNRNDLLGSQFGDMTVLACRIMVPSFLHCITLIVLVGAKK